ncbi:MAG: nitrilase-related carbon-nitrogen hydrolase [Gemmatimonadales bacterium]|jgi:N-carbamoylputrescine amidase
MTLRIALAQQAAGRDTTENLRRLLGTMDEAKRQGAELFCVPELAAMPFFPQHQRFEGAADLAEPIPGPTADRVADKAAALGMVTVFNMYERSGGDYFDSSPVFDADGSLRGVTRMVHITDYACFHEREYYAKGDRGAPVYETQIGRIGVAICYDRHFPEYMRALGVGGAELVVIPQAGALDEWPDGMYEAEVQTAAFQNGYFAALCNRVGEEDRLSFAGESFVVDPTGKVLARGARLDEDLVIVDVDLTECATSPARSLFLRDRRPELYGDWMTP